MGLAALTCVADSDGGCAQVAAVAPIRLAQNNFPLACSRATAEPRSRRFTLRLRLSLRESTTWRSRDRREPPRFVAAEVEANRRQITFGVVAWLRVT